MGMNKEQVKKINEKAGNNFKLVTLPTYSTTSSVIISINLILKVSFFILINLQKFNLLGTF